jgi:hypothetical protein
MSDPLPECLVKPVPRAAQQRRESPWCRGGLDCRCGRAGLGGHRESAGDYNKSRGRAASSDSHAR